MPIEPTTAPASDPVVDEEAEAQKAWDEFSAANGEESGSDPAPAAAAPDPAPNETDPAAGTPPAEVKDPDPVTPASDPKNTDGAAPDGAAPVDPNTPDLWADAPAELKAAHEAAQADLIRTRRGKSLSDKAMAGMRRKVLDLTQQLGELQSKVSDGKSAPAKADGADPNPDTPTTSQKPPIPDKVAAQLAAMKEEYPELGAMMESVVAEMASNTKAEIDQVSTQLSGLTAKQQKDFLSDQEKVVAEEHADFKAALGSPEFHAWYETAPAYKREAIERNGEKFMDGHEVSSLLKDFKLDTGWKSSAAPAPSAPAPNTTNATGGTGKPQTQALSDRRRKQLASASAPRTGSPATAAVAGIPEDPEAAWNFFKARAEK